MKIKDKRGLGINPLILLVAIILIIYFGFYATGSLTGSAITNEIRVETWKTYPIELQSSYFGKITSDSKHSIAGDNDGDVSINNEYTLGDELKLYSSIGSGGRGAGGNYLKAKFTLPKGILKGKCILIAEEYKNNYAVSKCSVEDFSREKSIHKDDLRDGVSSTNRYDFEMEIEEGQVINVYLEDSTGYSGGASSTILLTFEEDKKEIEDQIEQEIINDNEILGECIQNIDCINLCNSDQIPECKNGKCICENEIEIVHEAEGFIMRIINWITDLIRGIFNK